MMWYNTRNMPKTTQKKAGRPKKIKEPESSREYSISVTLGTNTIEGCGETLEKALASLPAKVKIVSKGIVSVEHDGKRIEEMYQPVRIKRLFFPMARHVVAKELRFLLK